MQDDDRVELTHEEQALLDDLPRRAEPPPGLEDRVVEALHARGALRRQPTWRRLAAVAAAFVLLVPAAYLLGVRVGEQRTSAATQPLDERPAFALLVFDPVGVDAPPEGVRAAVDEATQWAAELAEAGILVSAEKLTGDGGRLALQGGEVRLIADVPSPGEPLVLGGFFIIRAADYEEARRIAAACPLLRFDSIIEVRAFDDV